MEQIRKLISNYPVISFYIVTLFLLPVLGIVNLQWFSFSFDYALMLPQWAPALGALIVVSILNGKTGLKSLWHKTSLRETSMKWNILAIIIPVICCSLSYLTFMFIEYGEWIPVTLSRSLGNYGICLLATIFGCYGEELGWRGFMLPRLNQKYSLFISSFIVGFLWGLWHMRFQIGIVAFGLFIVGVICYSFLITWLCINTKNNIFVAIIFHTSINMCSLILFENVLSDITEQQIAVHSVNQYRYIMLYGVYAFIFAIPSIFIISKLWGKKTIGEIK